MPALCAILNSIMLQPAVEELKPFSYRMLETSRKLAVLRNKSSTDSMHQFYDDEKGMGDSSNCSVQSLPRAEGSAQSL